MNKTIFWYRTSISVLWFGVVMILMCLPADKIPQEDWLDKIYFDKFVHAGCFGLMSFLFIWPFLMPGTTELRIRSLSRMIIIGSSLLGMAIEIIQYYFIPGRQFDVLDWLADTAGAVLSWFLVKYLFKRMISPTVHA